MHIVIIAWLYVILMIAITEKSVVAGVMTFLFFGLAPCALLWWLAGGAKRLKALRIARQPAPSVAEQVSHQPDRADAERD